MGTRSTAREAALSLVVVALLAGCAGAASSVAVPTPTAAAPSASPMYDHPNDLAIGQCFDQIIDKGDESLLAGALKACDELHEAELFGRHKLPDPADAPYPGDSVVSKAAEEACISLFSDYVGIAYDDSRLAATYYTPAEATWVTGDRLVLCVVTGTSANPLTRSVKGLQE